MTLNFALNTVFHQAQLALQRLNAQAHHFVSAAVNQSGTTHPTTVNRPKCSLSTGYNTLDAALSDGGWPEAGTVEIVANNFAYSELTLFLPLLKKLTQEKQQVAWISPPQMPHLPTLQDHGIATENLQVVMAYGHTSYWAAEQAVCAGNARVLLYWPEPSVTAAQRNKLQSQANASGTLLFVLVSSDDAIASNANLRLQLRNSPIVLAQSTDVQNNATPTATDLLANTPAIIFEQPPRQSAASKRKKQSAMLMLTGIGYSSVSSNTNDVSQEASAQTNATDANAVASLRKDAAADLWVTLQSTSDANAGSLTIPICAAASMSTAEPKANATPKISEVTVSNNLISTSNDAQRRPILGHLQTSAQVIKLAQTRVDVLRLNRLIEITMPKENNTTAKLSTPSSRARQLALSNLRSNAAAPLIGQSLLRQQARNSSRARFADQTAGANFWAPSAIKNRTIQAALAQPQLA